MAFDIRALDAVKQSIRKAQNVSICFVVDCTGSMGPHIVAVKDAITQLVQNVEASGCRIAGIAFVGYRDWEDSGPGRAGQYVVIDFDTDIPKFCDFVRKIQATGGADAPEDVAGGLQQARNLSWPSSSASRVLLHIADAPAHGRRFNGGLQDDYPDGHPKEPKIEDIFTSFKQLDIQYFFGKINDSTKAMIAEFERFYGKKIGVADAAVPASILSIATASVMSTVGSVSAVASAAAPRSEIRSFVLDNTEPNFDRLRMNHCTIVTMRLEQVDLSVIVEFKEKLRYEHISGDIKIAPHPFDQGAERLAYYAIRYFKLGKDDEDSDEMVAKEYIKLASRPDLDRSRYMVSLETQAVASKLAFDFNDKISRVAGDRALYKIKFLLSKVIAIKQPDESKRFMMLEKRFRGGRKMVRRDRGKSEFLTQALQ